MEKAFFTQGHRGRFPWRAEEVKWGTDWDGMLRVRRSRTNRSVKKQEATSRRTWRLDEAESGHVGLGAQCLGGLSTEETGGEQTGPSSESVWSDLTTDKWGNRSGEQSHLSQVPWSLATGLDLLICVNSGSWWWTGRPGVLRFMGSQRVGHDWVTELNWTDHRTWKKKSNTRKVQTNGK